MTEASEYAIAMDWAESALLANSTVTDAVGDRIYEDRAPDDAEYPFIVYSLASSNDVLGLGTQRVMASTILTVKVVAEATRAVMKPLAAAMADALTLASGATTPDGSVFAAVRQSEIGYTENVNGRNIRHMGGEFLIQAQSN